MLKPARLLRSLAVLPLVAALASAVPAVRWCAAPMRALTTECLVACENGVPAANPRCDAAGGARCDESRGATVCAATCGAGDSRPCTGEPDTPISGAPCSREAPTGNGDAATPATHHPAPAHAPTPAPDGPRAFCIDAPPSATPSHGFDGLLAPAPAADGLASVDLPEPAVAIARPAAFEPPRPRSRPPDLPPPVRGPPSLV